MPIIPNRKPGTAQSIESFIAGAPDAGAKPADAPKRTVKGKQVQISHALPEALLNELDAFALRNNLKRAQLINMAIRQMMERGLTVQLTPADREGQS